MDLGSAKKLAELRGAIDHAPTANEEFERCTNESKLSLLGSRMHPITEILPKGKHNYRKFTHTFTAEDGSALKLEITVAYKAVFDDPDPDRVDPDSASYIVVLWSSGGHDLMIEQMDAAFIRDHTPEEVTNMFNRLEETVTAAEVAHATTTATTNDAPTAMAE